MANETMKAIQAQDYGDAGQLKLADAPRPTPGAGQVLVQLHAAGVNPADWKYRGGMYKQFMPLSFPWTPGLEGAGEVAAVGPDVTQFKVGDRVFGTINASYAEYAAVPVSELALIPAGVSYEEAAAIPVGALTAWQAIELADLKPGQRVLVQGAAGGVGLFVAQLAKQKGAHVIGTASTRNLDFVRSLGVDEAVDYTQGPVAQAVQPADAVIDTVGGAVLEGVYDLVKRGGHLVTVAGRIPAEVAQARGITAASGQRAAPSFLPELARQVAAKQLKVLVGQTYPLAQAADAHRQSETGHGRGRIVLTIP